LEDWLSGLYAEYDNEPFVNWRAGDCVIWNYNVTHMAANLGVRPRYTLQITGHI
jgi:alpha-ketoglutarate-dependent taurine dioxygenase